jgi:hypothetical protein
VIEEMTVGLIRQQTGFFANYPVLTATTAASGGVLLGAYVAMQIFAAPVPNEAKVPAAAPVADAKPPVKQVEKPAETTGSAPAKEDVAAADRCQGQTWPYLSRECAEQMQKNRPARVVATDRAEKPAPEAPAASPVQSAAAPPAASTPAAPPPTEAASAAAPSASAARNVSAPSEPATKPAEPAPPKPAVSAAPPASPPRAAEPAPKEPAPKTQARPSVSAAPNVGPSAPTEPATKPVEPAPPNPAVAAAPPVSPPRAAEPAPKTPVAASPPASSQQGGAVANEPAPASKSVDKSAEKRKIKQAKERAKKQERDRQNLDEGDGRAFAGVDREVRERDDRGREVRRGDDRGQGFRDRVDDERLDRADRRSLRAESRSDRPRRERVVGSGDEDDEGVVSGRRGRRVIVIERDGGESPSARSRTSSTRDDGGESRGGLFGGLFGGGLFGN